MPVLRYGRVKTGQRTRFMIQAMIQRKHQIGQSLANAIAQVTIEFVILVELVFDRLRIDAVLLHVFDIIFIIQHFNQHLAIPLEVILKTVGRLVNAERLDFGFLA